MGRTDPAQNADTRAAFIVRRTSVWDDEKPPCEEAYLGTFTSVDYRTFKNDAQALKTEPRWYDDGQNHRRSKGGGMQREFPGVSCWYVDLPDMESLLAFIERHGDVVIGPYYRNGDLLEIEIYDTYRE